MDTDVAIIGAGPYGLSVAAHLVKKGVVARTFGPPMSTWLENMPADMLLKSDGFASSLSAPESGWSLAEYCNRMGVPYGATEPRVPLDEFNAYGLAFQRTFVPNLDTRLITHLIPVEGGFALTLEDGETVTASRVVVAVGISHFAYTPPMLQGLGDRVTHSSDHRTFDSFKGKEVAVIGAGSSGVEVTAALLDAGATVHQIVRRPEVRFWSVPQGGASPRSLWARVAEPASGLGPGWRSKLCEDFPDAFRQLPPNFRLEVVRRHLGPVSPWWLRDKVVEGADILTRTSLASVSVDDDAVTLKLVDAEGASSELRVDHVICGTGYVADVDRLDFLDPEVRGSLKRVGSMPALTRDFESSIDGLYFVGAAAAGTFGPLLRFVVGTEFTAPRVSGHLARRVQRRRVQAVP